MELLQGAFAEATGVLLRKEDPFKDVQVGALEKQLEFINNNTAETLLYSGAYGAGKSRAICIKLVERAKVPGTREGLCRKWQVTLRATTLRTLLEPEGDLPPVLPMGTYTHNKRDQIIKIDGGGEIVYFGLDDPSKLGSRQLSGCAIDEMLETTYLDLQALEGRVRLKSKAMVAAGIILQIYGACNPGPPNHYLAEKFGLSEQKPKSPDLGCAVIRTSSADNTYLPEEYLARLARKTGVDRQRNYEGRWVGSDTLIYEFNPMIHVIPRLPVEDYILSIDDGWRHPFVITRMSKDHDGFISVDQEFKQTGMMTRTKLRAVADMVLVVQVGNETRIVPPRTVVVDPMAPLLIAELELAGYDVTPANNDVQDGIQRVRDLLALGEDGVPTLTVQPHCTETQAEFASYEAQVDRATGVVSEKPKKEGDDIMDTIRYGAAFLEDEDLTDLGVLYIG